MVLGASEDAEEGEQLEPEAKLANLHTPRALDRAQEGKARPFAHSCECLLHTFHCG